MIFWMWIKQQFTILEKIHPQGNRFVAYAFFQFRAPQLWTIINGCGKLVPPLQKEDLIDYFFSNDDRPRFTQYTINVYTSSNTVKRISVSEIQTAQLCETTLVAGRVKYVLQNVDIRIPCLVQSKKYYFYNRKMNQYHVESQPYHIWERISTAGIKSKMVTWKLEKGPNLSWNYLLYGKSFLMRKLS